MTTKLAEDYSKNKEKIKDINDKIDNLNKKMDDLQNHQYDLLRRLILEEAILAGTKWEMKIIGNGVELDCLDKRSDPSSPLSKLDNMLEASYHYSFQLEDGVDVIFDDNLVSLRFLDNRNVIPTAKKYKLQISSNMMAKKLLDLKRQVHQLETLAHQFNIKISK